MRDLFSFNNFLELFINIYKIFCFAIYSMRNCPVKYVPWIKCTSLRYQGVDFGLVSSVLFFYLFSPNFFTQWTPCFAIRKVISIFNEQATAQTLKGDLVSKLGTDWKGSPKVYSCHCMCTKESESFIIVLLQNAEIRKTTLHVI